jgi:outer membrane protein assembly factor BamB
LLVIDKKLFMVNTGGIMSWNTLAEGKQLVQERLQLGKYKVVASPIYAEGRIYVIDDSGRCFVIKADEKLTLLETNLLDEETYASPAASGGALYIRTKTTLYRLENKK